MAFGPSRSKRGGPVDSARAPAASALLLTPQGLNGTIRTKHANRTHMQAQTRKAGPRMPDIGK
jgi:hypothetical protein